MKKWCGMLTRLGGGQLLEFGKEFFSCFHRQIVVINDYAYVGIDLREDPNMVLPEGEDWDDDLGEFLFCQNIKIFLLFLKYLMFFIYSMFDCRKCGSCAASKDVPST